MNAHRVRLEPAPAVEPGKEVSCTVSITNTGDVVDAFTVEVLGDPARWATVEPASVSLFPGASGTARVTFRPPRRPEVPAGPTPFAVRVLSQDAGMETSVVEEGSLQVARFAEIAADVVPRTSHGRLTGRHRVRVVNQGNAPTTVRLSGRDDEQALQITFTPETLSLAAGGEGSAGLRARCARAFLSGSPTRRAFQVRAEAEATAPVEMQGAMEQRPVVGRWTFRALALALIAVVGLAVLHFQGANLRSAASASLTGARAGQASPDAGGSASPSPSASPSSPGGTGTAGTGGVSGGAAAGGAPAAIVSSGSCASNPVSYSAPNAAQAIPGLGMTVNNGNTPRLAMVAVSANLGVDVDAEVRVAYSVDGGPAQENAFGPANLANHQQYYETRAVNAVIPLAAGTHTVTPVWRISGAAGKSAHMDKRCMTLRSALASPPNTAPVIPASVCASNPVSNASPNPGQPIPGLAVTVDNGSAARQAVVEISANLGVAVDAEVRLAYSVDGGPAQENAFGPANLANYQQYYEGRAATAVIPLPAGPHTITPYWRISGVAGKTAYMDKRCLTVESAIGGVPASGPVVPAAACASGLVSTAAPNAGQPMPGLAVTVNNGGTARTALVEVSANVGIDVDAEVRLAYSVDGGPAQENAFGPANLANHQQYYETRAALAVIPLPAGSHTITAFWRVSGVAGKTAFMDRRCLTVDSVA